MLEVYETPGGRTERCHAGREKPLAPVPLGWETWPCVRDIAHMVIDRTVRSQAMIELHGCLEEGGDERN